MEFQIDLILGLVLAINVMLFLGQTAACNINPDCTEFYDLDGSLLGSVNAGNYTLDEDVTGALPETASGVSPTTGNFITDTFAAIKSWLLSIPGVDYLLGIVNAVPNFLKALGLPRELVFALGGMWYSLTLFLVIAWALGRS